MNPGAIGGRLIKRLLGRHSTVKSFEHELQAGGGMAGRTDAGVRTVEVRKVVGSVGQAMREGKTLPPLELYKVTRERRP